MFGFLIEASLPEPTPYPAFFRAMLSDLRFFFARVFRAGESSPEGVITYRYGMTTSVPSARFWYHPRPASAYNCRSGWNRQAIQTFPPSSTTRLHDRVLQAARREKYSRNMLISAAAASWRPRADCASPCAPSRHPEAGTSQSTEGSSSHFTTAHRTVLSLGRAPKKINLHIMQIFHHSAVTAFS